MITEGRTLLSYILGKPPSPGLIRRYVRAVQAVRGEIPLRLPTVAERYPGFLRLWEPLGQVTSTEQAERVARLHIATALAATTPEGARCRVTRSTKPTEGKIST